MNRPNIVIYDIPETIAFPVLKKNMMSIVDIVGPVASIVIPGREFYIEVNGHDTVVRSSNGVLFAQDVRANMADSVLVGMDHRMRSMGYSDDDINTLLILNMLNHARLIFTGGPKDCAPCFMLIQKKLAFYDRPYIKLVPFMDGAIAKAQINYECKTVVKPSYNETRIWEDGVRRNQMQLGYENT